jgi:hypothetical protein
VPETAPDQYRANSNPIGPIIVSVVSQHALPDDEVMFTPGQPTVSD